MGFDSIVKSRDLWRGDPFFGGFHNEHSLHLLISPEHVNEAKDALDRVLPAHRNSLLFTDVLSKTLLNLAMIESKLPDSPFKWTRLPEFGLRIATSDWVMMSLLY